MAADRRHDIDAEREPALMLGKSIREKRGGIGHDQRAADALHHAHADEVDRGKIALPRHEAERNRSGREVAKPKLYMRARPN